MNCLLIYIYFQILDGLSTVVALHTGANEYGPIARELIREAGLGPGITATKLVAIAVGVLAYYSVRYRPIVKWSNYVYAGVVLLNLFQAAVWGRN